MSIEVNEAKRPPTDSFPTEPRGLSKLLSIKNLSLARNCDLIPEESIRAILIISLFGISEKSGSADEKYFNLKRDWLSLKMICNPVKGMQKMWQN